MAFTYLHSNKPKVGRSLNIHRSYGQFDGTKRFAWLWTTCFILGWSSRCRIIRMDILPSTGAGAGSSFRSSPVTNHNTWVLFGVAFETFEPGKLSHMWWYTDIELHYLHIDRRTNILHKKQHVKNTYTLGIYVFKCIHNILIDMNIYVHMYWHYGMYIYIYV